jgi:PGDYG protein
MSPETIQSKEQTEALLVDLFSYEIEEKIRNDGEIYERRIIPLRGAKQLNEPQTVETDLGEGSVETTVKAKAGDWVITGAEGERFVLNTEKFQSRYRPDDKNGYIPREHAVIALKNPFEKPIKIKAPWGEYEQGGTDCYLVVSLDNHGKLGNDRYIIGDEKLLLNNYRLIKKYD